MLQQGPQSEGQGSALRAEQELRAAAGPAPLEADPQPSLADLAEGLDISIDEARALLTEVRVRRLRKSRYMDWPPAPQLSAGPPRPGTRGLTELGVLIALSLLVACAFGHAIAAAL